MQPWFNFTEPMTDPDARITSDMGKGWWKNVISAMDGHPDAPVNDLAWHPFDKVINGDANTGRIWSFAANGAVAAVTSPDFVDGYEYGFLFDRVGGSSGTTVNLRMNLWRETTGAYAGPEQASEVGGGVFATGFLPIYNARLVRAAHVYDDGIISSPLVNFATPVGITHATPQKLLRAQFTPESGNLNGTGAAIYMLRRRNILT